MEGEPEEIEGIKVTESIKYLGTEIEGKKNMFKKQRESMIKKQKEYQMWLTQLLQKVATKYL